jgi:L-asparaginase
MPIPRSSASRRSRGPSLIQDFALRTHRLRSRLGSALVLTLLAAATAAAQAPLPKVTVVATGGTIAGVSVSKTSFQRYKAGSILMSDMLKELKPNIDSIADVSVVQFGNRASGGWDIPDYYDLTLAVDKALETADAVVVTSGTGTMDEIVYWLDLTVRSQKPVIITGAMRPWTVIGTDGPANLFNAIVLASTRVTTCFGTVLMLNDEFHAAKDAFKSDAYRLDTFTSRRTGILGFIDDTKVHTFRAPPRVQDCGDPARWRTPFDLTKVSKTSMPRTEVLMAYQGAKQDDVLATMVAGGLKAVVLAGGGVPAEARKAAEAKGVVVVSTTRYRTGENNLVPQKARLLLMLARAFSDDPKQVKAWYDQWSDFEFRAPDEPGSITSGPAKAASTAAMLGARTTP